MVKLTPDLIQQAMQYMNPVRDRELDLRGYKIPMIENLGATLDQFDTIDFSDNDIRKLDNFPKLNRLKTLFFNNNRVIRIAQGIEESLENLETLILTGNQIQDLCDIDPLIKLPSLTTLSLLQNPVSAKAHYRQYLMYKLPQLRLLDFKKIKQKERSEAHEFFDTSRGKEILKDIEKRKAQMQATGADKPFANPDDRNKIREAITNASSLEEVQRLSRMLQSGYIPREDNHLNGDMYENGMEEDE